MELHIDIALRLAAAVLAGGIIGLNRDMHGKPAGIRVHALVATGAAILVLAAAEIGGAGDMTRAMQGIVGGIGFLGAGIIMRAEGPGNAGMRLHNLTTAATVWVAAALGVVCGAGFWALAAMAGLAIWAVLVAGVKLDRLLFGRLGPEDDGDGANR